MARREAAGEGESVFAHIFSPRLTISHILARPLVPTRGKGRPFGTHRVPILRHIANAAAMPPVD